MDNDIPDNKADKKLNKDSSSTPPPEPAPERSSVACVPDSYQNKTIVRPRAKVTQPISDKTVLRGKLPNQKEPAPHLENKALPDDKTVLRGKPLVVDKEVSRSNQHENALTRIRQSVYKQDSSQGFANAQRDADKALADDKIVLNKRFVLESTLGAGGMGTVYRALDLRKVEAGDLNPEIAVKVLNDDFKNHPDAFVTLQREASRSHLLSHPNIVTVHDFDRDGNVFYMTMELLTGCGLEDLMRKRRSTGFEKTEALKIIRDYCIGLIHAHKKNIIHSDFKPGNIFVSEDGTKILDFGIARITNQAANPKDFDAGTLGALTHAYASLEMINHESPHPSDDVFAAAIIAYELFSGAHPYDRKPADKALAENLVPERVKGLSNREWKSLEDALKLRRSERTQSIDIFLNGLIGKSKQPTYLIAGFTLAAMATWLFYISFISPDQLSIQIEDTFFKGQQCFNAGNYECAVDSAKAILKMDPKHQKAKELLPISEQRLLNQNLTQLNTELENCLNDTTNILCAKNVILSMKKLAPGSDLVLKAEAKISDFELSLNVSTELATANLCFSNADYDCALLAAQNANKLDSTNLLAIGMINKASKAIAAHRESLQRNMTSYRVAIENANKCFAKNDYNCTIKYARGAKLLVSENSEALSLIQKSEFSLLQLNENRKKADKLIIKGEKCLASKNYSCAIASAESALEIAPDYPQAISLRNNAANELERVKKSITIK